MTAAETKAIESLRKELASYHVEVREHVVRFDICVSAVEALQADVHGIPGDDTSLGLVGNVAKLQGSRRRLLIGLRGVWAVLLLGIGAMFSKVVLAMF